MATGDIRGNLNRLKRALHSVRYPENEIDESLASRGDPAVFLPMLHHVLLKFSRHVAGQILRSGYELYAKTDVRFVETVQKLLSSEFGYRMSLTAKQFFSQGFAERKMIMVHDVIQICRQRHNEVAKAMQAEVVQRQAKPTTSYRHSKIDEVNNDTIRVSVSPAGERGGAGSIAERQVVAYHVGSDSDGKLKTLSKMTGGGSRTAVDRMQVSARSSGRLQSRSPRDEDPLQEITERMNRENLQRRSVDELPVPQQKKVVRFYEDLDKERELDNGMKLNEDIDLTEDYIAETGTDDTDFNQTASESEGNHSSESDSLVSEILLEKIRVMVTQVVSNLNEKIEILFHRTKEMEKGLGARMTILESRIKFLEHKKSKVDTNTPTDNIGSNLQKNFDKASSLRPSSSALEPSPPSPTTPPIAPNPPAESIRFKHTKLPTSLPTPEFILAVEKKFNAAKKMIQDM